VILYYSFHPLKRNVVYEYFCYDCKTEIELRQKLDTYRCPDCLQWTAERRVLVLDETR
jgi:predicted RNA-binding Zn-ribbon protein involved in translation (DUF1610 family)